MSGPGFISVEPEMKCELCGIIAGTRPYGPNGERICFNCGQKDTETTKRQMRRYLFGETDHLGRRMYWVCPNDGRHKVYLLGRIWWCVRCNIEAIIKKEEENRAMGNPKPLKRMMGEVSVVEAAKLLGIDPKTVYRAIEKGELKGEKKDDKQMVALSSIGSYAYRKQEGKRIFDDYVKPKREKQPRKRTKKESKEPTKEKVDEQSTAN